MNELSDLFDDYARLQAKADNLFGLVGEAHPAEIRCTLGCSDCCYALFDLSLIEAMALNMAFNAKFGFGAARSIILNAAGEADRQTVLLKRGYYNLAKAGTTGEEVLRQAAQARIRCPLLGDDNACLLYDERPITCRVYGAPTAIHGKGHACSKSGFAPGQQYPTIALDRIQDKLAALSRSIGTRLGSRFKEIHNVYIPISMAILNRYDDTYLGLADAPKEK